MAARLSESPRSVPEAEPRIDMPPRPSRKEGNAGTFLALLGIVAVGGGLFALAFVVLPFVRGILIVGGGFIVMASLQYMVWGYWLSNRRPAGLDDSDDRTARSRHRDGDGPPVRDDDA